MKDYTEDRLHLDKRIVEYVEGRRLNINGIYEDIKRKIEFLRDVLGYHGLVVEKNQPTVPLEGCKPSRISFATRKEYLAAQKRLEKYRREQAANRMTTGRSLERTVQSGDF